ncbi:hypothetical protein ITP53_45945 [Nonomuraea sp. K274]|uniref:Uncharacterized protein n=1 Tax=Nonomuraea cypriaca TaxID=1187855 RepID=A0A931AQ43_9ACTN|nr:DUF4344 domain-containing metallopeptidase [Nonomuraea cypriaca]MBF8192902.1 hypothetical protein [Nonomuraea cypriaca]
MPHSLIALVLSMTSTLGAAPAPELTVSYESAVAPRAEQARKLLKDSGVLRTRIKLPQPIRVVARDCDKPATTWDREDRRITLCYSLVDKVRRTLTGIAETEESDTRTTAARVDGALAVLFHQQLGRALSTLNGLPDSDERADQFAALTLASDAPQQAAPAAEARHLLADHPEVEPLSGIRESATFACLLYGADPARNQRIAQGGWVPAERVPTCADEYNRVKSTIGSMAVKAGA